MPLESPAVRESRRTDLTERRVSAPVAIEHFHVIEQFIRGRQARRRSRRRRHAREFQTTLEPRYVDRRIPHQPILASPQVSRRKEAEQPATLGRRGEADVVTG